MSKGEPAVLKSRAVKLVVVAVLSVAMSVPLVMIYGVSLDRANRKTEAIWEVGRTWGGPQTLAGPFLVVPVEETRLVEVEIFDEETDEKLLVERQKISRPYDAILLPERLEVESDLAGQVRRRGMFEIPIYESRTGVVTSFEPGALEDILEEGQRLLWDEATLVLSIADTRAIRGDLQASANGRAVAFEPGSGIDGVSGIHAQMQDARALRELSFTLSLNGAERLRVAPAGRSTEMSMTADWPHPSFSGAFLPAERAVGPEGFEARWKIPHLARPVPQVWKGADRIRSLREGAFGVDLIEPVDLYLQVERAVKYGVLFIGLTFLTIFVLERLAERPVHPAQYFLVGIAQCVFYLLLLSLAEQIGFAWAYLAASAATVGLLVAYGAAGMKLGRRTGILGATLVVLYGVDYLILRSEDYALLAGSLLAFVTVALTMFATRNERWGAPQPSSDRATG